MQKCVVISKELLSKTMGKIEAMKTSNDMYAIRAKVVINGRQIEAIATTAMVTTATTATQVNTSNDHINHEKFTMLNLLTNKKSQKMKKKNIYTWKR